MSPNDVANPGKKTEAGRRYAGILSLLAAVTLLIGFFFPPAQWAFMLVAFAMLIAGFFVATIFRNR